MNKTCIATSVIDDAIDFANEDGVRVYRDYSGRGMYGETCFGLVGSVAAITKVLIALGSVDVELAMELASRSSRDSMGYDMIMYFPGYELDGESSGYDDDDD